MFEYQQPGLMVRVSILTHALSVDLQSMYQTSGLWFYNFKK